MLLFFVVISSLYLKRKFENILKGTLLESNSLDPDQDRQNVGPDLSPNCLQMLSADEKNYC